MSVQSVAEMQGYKLPVSYNTPSTTTNAGAGMSSNTAMGYSSAISAAGQVASTVISTMAQIAINKTNAQRQANVWEFNAKMAELNGRMTRVAADIEIKNIRKRASSLFSTQRMAYAHSGVRMEGSPAEVMVNSLKEAELDQIYTNISADYNVSIQRTNAGIMRGYGESAKYDSKLQNISSILKGANEIQGTFASQYNSYLQRRGSQ